MIYEIEITWRTLRREGFGPFFWRAGIYLRQLAKGFYFLFIPLPRSRDTGELVNFSFHAAGGLLQMAQARSEIMGLTGLVRERQPKTIVEIGTAHGGTLFLWCRLAHPNATIISLDLPGGIHGGGYPYWKTMIYRRFPLATQKLQLLRGDSHKPEMLAQLKSLLPGDGKVDYLFIDGDHTYEGVKSDFDMYSGLVREGGLIAFHDICKHPEQLNCHVDRYWQEVKSKYRASEFVEDPNQGGFGIGIVEVEKSGD
jgi:predicted O-methyltransferase YrrM